MPHIFIEGPDGSHKTQIVAVSAMLSGISPKKYPPHAVADILSVYDQYSTQSYLFDRSPIGVLAYHMLNSASESESGVALKEALFASMKAAGDRYIYTHSTPTLVRYKVMRKCTKSPHDQRLLDDPIYLEGYCRLLQALLQEAKAYGISVTTLRMDVIISVERAITSVLPNRLDRIL